MGKKQRGKDISLPLFIYQLSKKRMLDLLERDFIPLFFKLSTGRKQGLTLRLLRPDLLRPSSSASLLRDPQRKPKERIPIADP